MGKNIILCFDGTSDQFSKKKNTNIVFVRELISTEEDQVSFYDPGVGVASKHKIKHQWREWVVDKVGGNLFGYGLKKNVFDGYRFLMRFYAPGDKIFIFGFSRGAYTARVLASLLCKCGLLKYLCFNLIPSISGFYFKKKVDLDLMHQFKKTFCYENAVPYFMGVWDTVKSLGFFYRRQFSSITDEILNPEIPYGFQALAIDEKRNCFKPSLWDLEKKGNNQTIEQVWFAGAHSDVGGGYYCAKGLSNISLIWMLEKVEAAGLVLKKNWKKQLSPNPIAMIHKSWKEPWWIPWWVLGISQRKIPEAAHIHESVLRRVEQDATYCPQLPAALIHESVLRRVEQGVTYCTQLPEDYEQIPGN